MMISSDHFPTLGRSFFFPCQFETIIVDPAWEDDKLRPTFFPPYLREGFFFGYPNADFSTHEKPGSWFYAIKAGATFEVVYLGYLSKY